VSANLTLRDMSAGELADFLAFVKDDYIVQRIGAGDDEVGARAEADSQWAILFPGGQPGENQFVMRACEGETGVGSLWMGRPLSGSTTTWFVFFVTVDADRRGRGYGRATMEAAERWTREKGGSRIGLNVFGPNVVARNLYDDLGYQVMATQMFKDLA
jgi:GNAT superfamily N-acetyltransferase